MHLSIIIPAYNEAKRLPSTLEEIDRYLCRQSYDYEIVAVDDGSEDGTADIVRRMTNQISHLRLVSYRQNRGKGYAVRRGMLTGKGKFRIYVDADNAVSLDQIEDFWPYLEGGKTIVIGSIELPGATIKEHAAGYRRRLGKWSKLLIRLLTIRDIHDTQRAFKLFPAAAAERIFSRQTINGWGFDIEILIIARNLGYRIKELPVTWINPGNSKVTLKSYLTSLSELLTIKWNLVRGKYQA